MTGPGDINIIGMMLKKSREKRKTAGITFDNERYDDTVSRLYYALFHSISAVLMSKGLHFSSHKATIGAFNKEFIMPGTFPKNFSKIIQRLFIDRQAGDYDFGSYIGADVAVEDLKEVDTIISACEEYLAKIYNVTREFWQ